MRRSRKGRGAVPGLFAGLLLLAACTAPGGAPKDNLAGGSGPSGILPGEGTAATDNGAASALFLLNGEPVGEAEYRLFVETIFPDEMADGSGGMSGWTDTFINNRLLAARAESEGLHREKTVRSRLETRLNHLWRDVYWSEVIKPSLRFSDADLLKEAPAFEPMVSLQQLIVETRGEAEELREKALRGEDFGAIIRERSVGLTAKEGGMVGFVRPDSKMYDPALLATLFAMKEGEYTQVTESPIGYTVIRVLEKRDPERLRKDWFRENRERLVQARERREWDRVLDALVARHKVTVNRKAADAFIAAREKGKPLDSLMGKTLVTVDNVALTVQDVTDPSGQGIIHGNQAIEQIVQRRVENLLIDREAEKRGLKEKYPEIARKERFLRENLLARAYVDFRSRGISVTEADLKAYYEENRERFAAPRAIDVSLIETRSQSRLEEIYRELAGGAPFGEVADRWSDNKSVKEGRVGFVEEARIAPEFAAVKKLRPGEYAKTPIRLRAADGVELFVVARLNGVREKKALSFREVDQPSIQKAVTARKREEVIGKVLDELKETNRVEFTPAYDRFKTSLDAHTNVQGGRQR